MADYYSLLSKLLEGAPNASRAVREGIYDRARRALSDQLKSVTPALSLPEIAREETSLDEAIARLEGEMVPGRQRREPDREPPPLPEPAVERAPEPDAASERPKVFIRPGGRRQRPRALLAGLVIAAVPMSVLAWMWRDRPAAPVEAPAERATAAAPVQADTKYNERVGGAAAPPRPATAAAPAPAAQPPGVDRLAQQAPVPPPPAQRAPSPPPPAAPSAPPLSAPDVAVAQRAMVFEENPADPQNPVMTTGRAIWRIDGLNTGQGQPLETVIRGSVEMPAAALVLGIVIRRNLDAALPASHTIELTFTMGAPPGGGPARVVRDVLLPMMRPEETIRGVPVAGLPVPVKENLFLIGLSDLKGDVERNTELLLNRSWIELPLRFASGQKAVLLFDKGVSGERVFNDVFRQWGRGQ